MKKDFLPYKYIAVNSFGLRKKGYIFAKTEFEVVAFLRQYQLVPINIMPTSMWLFMALSWLCLHVGLFHPKAKTKLAFLLQMKDLLAANLPLTHVFQTISHTVSKKIIKYQFYKAAQLLNEGYPLGIALDKSTRLIDKSQLSLILHAEKSAHLFEAFEAIYKNEKASSSSFFKTLMTVLPLLLANLVTVLGLHYFTSTTVAAIELLARFKDLRIRAPERLFIYLFGGNLFVNIIAAICISFILFALIKYFIKITGLKSKVDSILLYIPILKENIRLVNLELFIRGLALSLSSKVPLHIALKDVCSSIQQSHYKKQVQQLVDLVYQGSDMVNEVAAIDLFKYQEVTLIKNAMTSNNIEQAVDLLMEMVEQKKQAKQVLQTSTIRFTLIFLLATMILFGLSTLVRLYIFIL